MEARQCHSLKSESRMDDVLSGLLIFATSRMEDPQESVKETPKEQRSGIASVVKLESNLLATTKINPIRLERIGSPRMTK